MARAEAVHPVRCPSASCGETFSVTVEWLGRNMHCPVCGVRLTARPAALAESLERRQRQARGAEGAAIGRLPLTVLVDNVRSLWNVGSIFRTADACGVERLVLCGITGCPPRSEITKTALGAEAEVAWEYHADAGTALDRLVAAGWSAVALEAGERSQGLDTFRWPERVCLVIGNEVAGVSPDLLARCAGRVSIPMRGVKDSLNVAVAFGIAAHGASAALARSTEVSRSCAG